MSVVAMSARREESHFYPDGRLGLDYGEKVGHYMSEGCLQVILQHVDSSTVCYKRLFCCSQLSIESRGSGRS